MMLMPFIIPIFLFIGQNLANPEFQLDRKIEGKSKCQNPKEKFYETNASSEIDDVCKDVDNGTSNRIIPLDFLELLWSIFADSYNQWCPICWLYYGNSRPYCQGSCSFGLRCSGTCRSTASPAKECIHHALKVSYDDCKTECRTQNAERDPCHSCITKYVPEKCQSFESFNQCASCSRPIFEVHTKCQLHADLLQCIRDNINPTCEPCIGSVGCKLFSAEESDICTLSQNISDLWIHSESCPPSWIYSENDLQVCFKVFKLEKPYTWNQAEAHCKNFNGQLAISDSENKINSITDSLGDTNAKESWISGKQPQSSPSTFKWIPLNTNVTQNNWSGNCPTGKNNTCMYIDENGYWCNQDCNEKYHVVCQQNVNVSKN